MNSLNRVKTVERKPQKDLESRYACIDQEGRRIDKRRGRDKDKGNGDKGWSGKDRSGSAQVDVNTQGRGLFADSGRKSSGIIVAENRYRQTWRPDEEHRPEKMMIIETARHGDVEIDKEKTIQINGGLIGFGQAEKFVFLPFMEGTEFELFQSIEHKDLGFIMVDPFLVSEEYEFELSDADQEELRAEKKEDLIIRVIVTIPDEPRLMTANMQGPIVIHKGKLIGKQVILHDMRYDTKHRIFPDE